ncbi:MAG: ribosome small subunit-dependent GTPase A [Candidatus Fermentibacteraceae bacterium]|nr:ribosome small subunit-dependent GTPase A [Candidatus Fermentibacteraceae bacterium]
MCGDVATVANRQGAWYVEKIETRKGILERTSPVGKRQVLAANIDLVVVVASIASPPLRRGFVDRALASAEWNHLPAALVFNKIDLRKTTEAADLTVLEKVYGEQAGYTVLKTSTVTGEGIDNFKNLIRGKTVALAGVSATGKTSLIQAIHPHLNLRIGAVNAKTTKGKHTTVSARLIPLENNTFLMDTPGLRAFSVDHIPKAELGYCFPEFEGAGRCRFRNCIHETEPGCAVLEAVENGTIDRERHLSYLKLLHEDNTF